MPAGIPKSKATEKTKLTDSGSQQIARAQAEWLRILARTVVRLFSTERKKV
ncbi:hypothetical protein Pan153_41600 [Gimesia panareensis]|uniref:Uncharacterized protein n=1 Tax=Gimesia panareensis TaxID=2527978 RepID=A0A518FT26_9PLAN|nr:hypothetical protein Pan153_41600 [Gimesia panareensis]